MVLFPMAGLGIFIQKHLFAFFKKAIYPISYLFGWLIRSLSYPNAPNHRQNSGRRKCGFFQGFFGFRCFLLAKLKGFFRICLCFMRAFWKNFPISAEKIFWIWKKPDFGSHFHFPLIPRALVFCHFLSLLYIFWQYIAKYWFRMSENLQSCLFFFKYQRCIFFCWCWWWDKVPGRGGSRTGPKGVCVPRGVRVDRVRPRWLQKGFGEEMRSDSKVESDGGNLTIQKTVKSYIIW